MTMQHFRHDIVLEAQKLPEGKKTCLDRKTLLFQTINCIQYFPKDCTYEL